MLDIETLRIIWWLLLGVLLIGFAITDGWDFGAAILMPFIARDELEKRIVLNVIGPFWEGNQVWIILGAGAMLAAWPFLYAVAFSGFYFLMLILLLTMGISRPVSFKYRSKINQIGWKHFWDKIVFIGGIVPAGIFGILIGNALKGAPFDFDATLRITYAGSFLQLFSPFALLCGLTSISMLTMQGGVYLGIKTEGVLQERALKSAKYAAFFTLLLTALLGYVIAFKLPGYELLTAVDPQGVSNPLHKMVELKQGAWLNNYIHTPYTLLVPFCGLVGALGVLIFAALRFCYLAFLSSCLCIAGIIGSVGVSLFPFILPSSLNPNVSLLIWDASSSRLTLEMMLVAAIIFLPLILMYTAWVFYVLRGKVTKEILTDNQNHAAL